jgi:hypothetical protein
MKTLIQIVTVSLFLVFLHETVVAQPLNDQSQVLQKCIDLAELQQYYPQNADKSYKQLRILNFPVSFPESLSVSKFGQSVLFQTRAEIHDSNPDAFMAFNTFSIIENKASIVFEISYNRLSQSPNSINGSISLDKTSGNWIVTNLTLNNQ